MLSTLFSREFLGAFGAILLLALAVGAAVFVIAAYFVKLKQLEAQVEELKRELSQRLDSFAADTRSDFDRERHMINESLSGISETMMRAVLSVKDRDKQN